MFITSFFKNKYGQFILRALVTGAIGALTYVGANITDIADPSAAASVTTLATATANLLQAKAMKEGEGE